MSDYSTSTLDGAAGAASSAGYYDPDMRTKIDAAEAIYGSGPNPQFACKHLNDGCEAWFWDAGMNPARRFHMAEDHPPTCTSCRQQTAVGLRPGDGLAVCWGCTPPEVTRLDVLSAEYPGQFRFGVERGAA